MPLCHTHPQFIAAWEYVVVVAALVVVSRIQSGLHSARPFWAGMFAISTMLFMLASDAFLTGISAVDTSGVSAGVSAQRRMQTTAAGAIITTVANVSG